MTSSAKSTFIVVILLIIAIPIIYLIIKNNMVIKNNMENKKSSQKNLGKIVQKNLEKNITRNDIFLDFKLGNTKETTNDKIRNLINKNELETKNNKIVYYFNIGQPIFKNKAPAYFKLNYYDNKLYELSLNVKPIPIIGSSPTKSGLSIFFYKLVLIYIKKYGPPSYEEPNFLYDDVLTYYWVIGNRQIKLNQAINSVLITYTDLRIKEQKENADKVKEKQNKEELKQDI